MSRVNSKSCKKVVEGNSVLFPFGFLSLQLCYEVFCRNDSSLVVKTVGELPSFFFMGAFFLIGVLFLIGDLLNALIKAPPLAGLHIIGIYPSSLWITIKMARLKLLPALCFKAQRRPTENRPKCPLLASVRTCLFGI